MRTLKLLSTALILAVAVIAFAQEPTQWGFVRAITFVNPGLTQFEVLRNDERGGEIRFVVSPKDAACTSGATYLVSWSFVGDIRRITRGQKILVNLASKQLAGPRCDYSEPVVVTGQGNWDMVLTRSPLASTYPDYDSIATLAGYQEFYLRPEERGARHRASPWTVVVGENARRRIQMLPVTINTSGASGGQMFVAALVYDANAAGSPASTPPPSPPTPVARPGMAMQTDRPGSDYRSFDLPVADPGLCQTQCMQEGQCVAWTYVNPGVQGPQARCWLKSAVPNLTPSTCCVSGVKTRP